LLVAWVIASIASGLIQSGFDALMSTSLGDHVFPAAVLDALGGVVAGAVVLPIEATAVAMIYFDLRARKERLDLDELARCLDIEPGTVAPPRAAVAADARPTSSGTEPRDEPNGWAPPEPPGDVAPPSDWAPPRPPGPEDS
jgi:hypothetical protein